MRIISQDLQSLLTFLTAFLEKIDRFAEFHIIGSFAMELQGYERKTHTTDIDLIQDPEDENVAAEINRLGAQVQHELWMNLNASDIPLPEGFEGRTERVDFNDRITFVVPSREDMVLLKMAAAIDRVKDDRKDIDDLRLLNPLIEEIEKGVEFYRQTRMREIANTKFEENVKQRIALVRRLLGV